MSRAERIKTTACLYFNYLIHGMAIVILAQNMAVLGRQWHVGDAGVSMVISSLGIGRLLVLYVSGTLSDRLGRKLFIRIGIATYAVFFVGIILSESMMAAYFFGILAGMANSFLDSGTYPALMELYPRSQASANIMIKAFASVGELILPIFVAVLEHFNIWYGWTFVFCAAALAINFLAMRSRVFPKLSGNPRPRKEKITPSTQASSKTKLTSRQLLLGVILTIFGYVSMSTFYLVSQWLTKYGSIVGHLNMVNARLLVSVYSVGSIIGVITTAILVNRFIKPIWFMIFDTVLSFIALLLITLFPTEIVMLIASFVIGCTAAGGVMQIGLTIMGDLFPSAKGRITGIYYTASGLASFTIPVFTAIISKTSIHNIMWFDVGIAAIGILCSISVLLIERTDRLKFPSHVTESIKVTTKTVSDYQTEAK
ncbi:MFS transporter [Lentilactobacillus diolivorans]|uniref:MFS family major facilitator transporter n=2 Tax=Lentilactobacillus diolivorans TaxID=179838 RepID=A0A0R1SRN8_9LACO|nr:MFS transporter [Lentilactobacillus diolivorans]KRL69138.1 MFS family major facilitator transporter [Lentilactobacillus diolivorans DSM 14421]GEP22413.1 MFS transporter [Lentilactobacillus diolivorans]